MRGVQSAISAAVTSGSVDESARVALVTFGRSVAVHDLRPVRSLPRSSLYPLPSPTQWLAHRGRVVRSAG